VNTVTIPAYGSNPDSTDVMRGPWTCTFQLVDLPWESMMVSAGHSVSTINFIFIDIHFHDSYDDSTQSCTKENDVTASRLAPRHHCASRLRMAAFESVCG
jgi:hypothetical protein